MARCSAARDPQRAHTQRSRHVTQLCRRLCACLPCRLTATRSGESVPTLRPSCCAPLRVCLTQDWTTAFHPPFPRVSCSAKKVLLVLLAIIFPPLVVLMERGCGYDLLLKCVPESLPRELVRAVRRQRPRLPTPRASLPPRAPQAAASLRCSAGCRARCTPGTSSIRGRPRRVWQSTSYFGLAGGRGARGGALYCSCFTAPTVVARRLHAPRAHFNSRHSLLLCVIVATVFRVLPC